MFVPNQLIKYDILDTRIPIGMRYNIDAFIQRQKLRSTIAPPFFRPLAILPPAIELIERVETPRELNAPPGIIQTKILTVLTLFICFHFALPLSQRFR